MANLKELLVNGVSRFIGKVYINDSHITTINGVTVTESPKFTDTTALGSMTGTLGVGNGGTGKTSGKDAANYFMNALDTGSSTPADADYYISQYVNGGTSTTTYHRRPMSALWEYIKSKISSILGLTATTYSGSAAKVNNHTVNSDVPSNAKFTDTVTTATTSGSGNAVTAITASNGALTVTKGTTFLTSHQDISGKADKSATVSTVAYDSTNKKIIKTINGTTSDVVTAATLKTAMGLDNAEANQNAFSNVKVGSTTVSADSKTDTLELAAGNNITLTPDATNDKVTISATDTTYSDVTAGGSSGLMTGADKTKLNGIASGAEVNQNAFSNVKIGSTTVAADAKTDTLELVAGSNVTLTPDATNDKITIAATDTTYSNATTSAAGLMSAQDKTRLNSIGVGISGISNTVTWDYVKADGITVNVAPVDSSTGLIPVENLPEVVAGGTSGIMTGADKTKLNGIATGAEVNQNAFSNVKVGSTTVAADAKTDTLELVAGSNITLTPDATNDKITIAATNTTYSDVVAGGSSGLMSGADKTKLNGIATGAEVNQNAFSNVKVGSTTVAADGKTDTLELVAGNNITLTPDATNDKVTITATNTTYSDATTTTHGLMSVADKTRLDGLQIEEFDVDEYYNITLDGEDYGVAAINTSTGKIFPSLVPSDSNKVDKVTGKGLSTNDFTDTLQTKLNGIATGAQVNQNAFSNVKVGSTTIAADGKTDTLQLVAGTNITLTPDATNDKITISATGSSGGETNQNAFSNVKVGSVTIAADSKTDTLELVAGDNIVLTSDATNDKVTITMKEGHSNTITGTYAHAQGQDNNAFGYTSHTEGYDTEASGDYSHTEGYGTESSGFDAHAQGHLTIASGDASHAGGSNTIAAGSSQTAIGKFNVEDTDETYALIVGNGTDDNNRSNAMTVDWDGNLRIQGALTKNGQSLFKKEDVTVSVTYAAGTIGSRGGAISLGTTSKSGYAYLGAFILNNQSTSTFSATISRNDDTANAMLLVYRATGNAVNDAEIKVRKIWVLNSFLTSV